MLGFFPVGCIILKLIICESGLILICRPPLGEKMRIFGGVNAQTP